MSKGSAKNCQKKPRTLDFPEPLTFSLRNKYYLLTCYQEWQGKFTKNNLRQKKKKNVCPYLSSLFHPHKYVLVTHNPQFKQSKEKEHYPSSQTFVCLLNSLYKALSENGNYQSCFRTACPFRVSTLKLFVFAGMMKNTTTVTSVL